MPEATWRSNCRTAKPWATPSVSAPPRNDASPISDGGGRCPRLGAVSCRAGGQHLARSERNLLDEQLQRENPARRRRRSALRSEERRVGKAARRLRAAT